MFLPVLAIATVAMVPQDPAASPAPTPAPAPAAAAAELSAAVSISDLQYVGLNGTVTVVPARNIVEIRLLDDRTSHIRLELFYENGDYSLVDAQAFHLLRSGASPRPVKLVRGVADGMRFPRSLIQ
jgi:hypothetical protein